MTGQVLLIGAPCAQAIPAAARRPRTPVHPLRFIFPSPKAGLIKRSELHSKYEYDGNRLAVASEIGLRRCLLVVAHVGLFARLGADLLEPAAELRLAVFLVLDLGLDVA